MMCGGAPGACAALAAILYVARCKAMQGLAQVVRTGAALGPLLRGAACIMQAFHVVTIAWYL